ncbi:MAG: cupin domain-containing protein [Blastocatellia bacterium]|nr:cupin domain-containing protein [Blastocatellia bacterium]
MKITTNMEADALAQSPGVLEALPREIANAVTGDRMKLIHSAADGHATVRMQFTLPPHAMGAPLHYHLTFVESFDILDGRLQMTIGSERTRRRLAPGERIEVAPGTLHSFNNPHETPVTFVTEAAPAAEFEKFIRSMYGLANDGRTNRDGMPADFLHLALILDFADLYFPSVPAALQRVARKALGGFARSIGKERELSKYYAA